MALESDPHDDAPLLLCRSPPQQRWSALGGFDELIGQGEARQDCVTRVQGIMHQNFGWS
jgi:hypothetical protein